jgi:hypothetical protein
MLPASTKAISNFLLAAISLSFVHASMPKHHFFDRETLCAPLFSPSAFNILSPTSFAVAFKLRELNGAFDKASEFVKYACAENCDNIMRELNVAELAWFDVTHALLAYTGRLSVSISMYVDHFGLYTWIFTHR